MRSTSKILDEKTKTHGYNMTRPRKIIFDELFKMKGLHPDAAEIYQVVRNRLPKISYGTVYRSLRLLKKIGLVRELSYGKRPGRFEAIVDNHQHFICTTCEKVSNVDGPIMISTSGIKINGTSVDVEGFRLEFYGTCDDCSHVS